MEGHLIDIGIEIRNIQDLYPCTARQDDMFLSSSKGSNLYEPYFVWECIQSIPQECIEPNRLMSAWREIVRRHNILRTIFTDHPESDRGIQVVLAEVTAKVKYFEKDVEDPAKFLSQQSRPDLSSKEPWHMFSVCRGVNNTVACRLDIHHMYCDAVSTAVMLSEISKVYRGVVLRPASQIRELVKCNSERPDEDKRMYWINLLEHARPCCIPPDLSVDDDRTSSPEIYCSTQVNVPPGTLEFCQDQNFTRSTLIQVAWAFVLTTFAKEKNVCFGYMVSGRDANHADVETTVGPYISMLVAVIDSAQPIRRVLETAHKQTIQSLDFQHTSRAKIQEHVGRGPLFNTAMTVRDRFERDSLSFDGLGFRPFSGEDPYEVSSFVSLSLRSRPLMLR